MLVMKGSYDDLRKLCSAPRIPFWSKYNQKAHAKISDDDEEKLFTAAWLHTIGLNFEHWSKPHYRAESLRCDLAANFSNIAFPGTGIPMSLVCRCKAFAF